MRLTATDFTWRRRPESCLSDLALDRLLLGEPMARPWESAARHHLGGCSRCAGRLEELRRAQRLDEPFVRAAVARARGHVGRPYLSSLTRMAMLAALVLLFVTPLLRRAAVPGGDGERAKGSAVALELGVVVRHRNGVVERLAPGGRVAAGEAIRFQLSSDRNGYLVVLGLDAAPRATAYVPGEARGMAIERGRGQLLPGSIVLDETLGPERIVAVMCGEPIEVTRAVTAGERALARADGDPRRVDDLGLGCVQSSFVVEKIRMP